VLPINGISESEADALNAQFATGTTKAYLVHLAEGIDEKSRDEFELLRDLNLLKPQVVGIHSTALTTDQLNEMGQIGMKIVWSPLSNLILYGQTTDIPTAIKAGVKVAIAPDWTPSGSANVLGELKVADRVNRERFGGFLTDRQIVEMATSAPAQIAALDDKLGTLAPGYYADLVVIRKASSSTDPYRAIIDAKPQDVLLTVIDGQPYYGDPDLLSNIGATRDFISVDACGETRNLSTAESNPQIPGGNEDISALTTTFTNDGVQNIIPLFQCDPAPEFAFQ
jgi:cytosine/adenosine deaminase-related metal-dependent hydrolase